MKIDYNLKIPNREIAGLPVKQPAKSGKIKW
jgi:hypothetical protein